MSIMRIISYLFIMSMCICPVQADGGSWIDNGAPLGDLSEQRADFVQPPDTPMPGADAKLSDRLPPMLPGQEVQAGGRKMKVWSSSGPVPVSGPPEPWNEDEKILRSVGGIGVVIDRPKQGFKDGRPPRAR